MGVYNGKPIGEPLKTSIQIGREYFIVLVKWNNGKDLYQKLINTN